MSIWVAPDFGVEPDGTREVQKWREFEDEDDFFSFVDFVAADSDSIFGAAATDQVLQDTAFDVRFERPSDEDLRDFGFVALDGTFL